QKYPNIRNVEFLYRDGKEGLVQEAPYDGIHVAFAFNEIPESLKTQLKVNGGILVCSTEDYNVRVVERKSIDEYEEDIVSGFVFDKGKEGLAYRSVTNISSRLFTLTSLNALDLPFCNIITAGTLTSESIKSVLNCSKSTS